MFPVCSFHILGKGCSSQGASFACGKRALPRLSLKDGRPMVQTQNKAGGIVDL
jgi:hypothetical protein